MKPPKRLIIPWLAAISFAVSLFVFSLAADGGLFAHLSNEPAPSTTQHRAQQERVTVVAAFSGHTDPAVIRVHRENEWSTIGYLDLTDEALIPVGAVVTKITVTGDSSGGFSKPRLAVSDEKGERFILHQLSGQTTEHAGKPVRQRWSVQFWTDSIWDSPAMLRPILNIHYKEPIG